MNQVANHRKWLDSLLADYDHTRRQVVQERKNLQAAREQLDAARAAQKLLQTVAEGVQASAHQQIASVVTRCLEAVFGDEAYEFKIRFVQKRGKTEAELLFLRDGLELDDPLNSSGGGVVDVASFALRLVCLMLERPKKRRLLVLDEPFRFLSKDYRPRIRQLLLELSKELSVQMIFVTHDPLLTCGKVIELGD